MHCAMCVNNIEKILSRQNGIKQINVNLNTERAYIEYQPQLINLEKIQELIETLGFQYLGLDEKINPETEEKQYQESLKNKKNRVIVGFTSSIILMALMYLKPTIPILNLSQLSLIITIIPFIYVTLPILKAGIQSLTHFNLNMDVMYTMGILIATIASLMSTFHIYLDHTFMFYETTIMLASFLTLGRYLEERAKKQTSTSIKDLINLQPQKATILHNNKEETIPIELIQVNDTLIVKPGEKIPTDAIITQGKSYIDESMINGEPIPSLKKENDTVYGGTINTNSLIHIKATHIGKDTILSQIIRLVENAQNSKPPAQKLADKVVKYFIPTILIIAIISLITWYLLGYGFHFALTTFISILVVACPCALGLATPTAITVGMGRAAQLGILIKDGKILEETAQINLVAFDKTGTITEGKPTITNIKPYNTTLDKLINITYTIEKNSQHPLAQAITQKLETQNTQKNLTIEDFQEIQGKGVKAKINNNTILAGNKKILKDHQIQIPTEIQEETNQLEEQGKTIIYISKNNLIIGIIALQDQIKEETTTTIKELHKMNIDTLILSGDNQKTVNKVAQEIGIKNTQAEILPQDKQKNIKKLQTENKSILFAGDGINDAPALSQANVGVAMGNATDIAIETGDIVLIDGNLTDLVAAIQLSQKIRKRIKENIFWAFAYNIILIPLAAGLYYPIWHITISPEFSALAMALSSITVISLSLLLKKYTPKIKK